MEKKQENNTPGCRKLFVASDIHGYFNQWQAALHSAGWEDNNENHVLVVLGDLLDRGPQPLECLKFVNALPSRRKILVRGNHEDLMEAMIARRDFRIYDWQNGTAETAFQLARGESKYEVLCNMRKHKEYNAYISSLVDYYENDSHVFCHGWIPCLRNDPNIYHARDISYTFLPNWREGDWEAARWINGMDAWAKNIRVLGKTVVCGHWHTSWGHHHLHHDSPEWDNKFSTNPDHRHASFAPFVDEGILAIDACTAVSGKVNVVVLEEKENHA